MQFPSKYINKVFDVVDFNDENEYENLHMYVYPDKITICSSDYSIILEILPKDVESIVFKDRVLTITYKNTDVYKVVPRKLRHDKYFSELILSPIKDEKIHNSFKILSSVINDEKEKESIYNELKMISNDLVYLIDETKITNDYLIDMLSCVYLTRFSNSPNLNVNHTELFKREFYLSFLEVLLNGLEHTSYLQFDNVYSKKIIGNLGELIVKLSKVLNLDCEKIISCCSLYFKTGNKSALKYEAKTLNNLIKKDLFDKRLDDDINEQMINHLYSISIVELCGILLEIDEFDLNHFSELFVDVFFMNGVQNLQKVDKEMKTFIGNLLKKSNSKRYEKEFILVFSLWNLKDNY